MMAKSPAWQRAEGKNPEGGLNEKGRASLRAAGHDIKRPQPEGGSRRDSFCARMKGMKAKLTSSETANDPDSRINKSLRKWNCADGGAVDPYDSVQQAAKGGPIWDRPRPKKLGKSEPLSPKQKASAKAAAKAAGRPYPNLIDNMRAARADGGPVDDRAHEFVQEQLRSGEPQVPQYVAENDFPARAARGVQAVDTAASRVNNMLADIAGQPAMRSPEGRSASEIVQSAMPIDPYQAVQQAAGQWRGGDKLGAAETMATAMPMQGAITPGGAFAGKTLPKIENLANTADKFVYHSGVAEDLPVMKDYLEPQHGSWIRELAEHFGADDPKELLETATPLVWMSEKPNWVASKVARQLGKHVNDVTEDEIRQFGHVAIVPKKSEDAEHIWHVGEKGLDEGQYSNVTNLRSGEPTKAYNTELYDYDNRSEPFGVERNEYVSARDVSPMFHLTGDELIKFLKLTGQPRGKFAHGGEVEGDVQFAFKDPYAKVQEAARLPMMAQNEYFMRMPQSDVRYDTGPQPGEATMKAYEPTIKERIYQTVAGTEERPSPERAQFARGISNMAEFAPVLGNVMAGQEAQRRGDSKGMLMAALPVPGMATEARMAQAAITPAEQAAKEALLALHNMKSHRLDMAEKLGGLPVPSIAIAKPEHGFTGFGDITLVGGKEFATPSRTNPVFASDVYSPRFPNLSDEGDKIFRGYTPAGYRRYAPLNMQNVVREMKGNIRGGENYNYGAGNVRASVTPQFKKLSELQRMRDKIIPTEDFEPLKEEANAKLFELAEKFHPYSRYSNSSFGHASSFAQTLSDVGKGRYSAFNQDYKDLPDELKVEAAEYLNYLRGMPTEYFEAKPQRAVELGEFAGAVVPEEVMKDVEPKLKNLGIREIVPFNPEEQDAQKKAFREFKGFNFADGGEVVNKSDPYDNIQEAAKIHPRARRASH